MLGLVKTQVLMLGSENRVVLRLLCYTDSGTGVGCWYMSKGGSDSTNFFFKDTGTRQYIHIP